MPRRCTVCAHDKRDQVDAALVNGEPRKLCADCGTAKPRSAFSPAMWKWRRKDRACLACVQVRLARLALWHTAEYAERQERLRLAAEFHARREAEHAAYLAQVPGTARRRRRAQGAIGRLKTAVIARNGYLCGICGEFVRPEDLSIDHIVPVAIGGTDLLDNLQVAHRVCNSRKGCRRVA